MIQTNETGRVTVTDPDLYERVLNYQRRMFFQTNTGESRDWIMGRTSEHEARYIWLDADATGVP